MGTVPKMKSPLLLLAWEKSTWGDTYLLSGGDSFTGAESAAEESLYWRGSGFVGESVGGGESGSG